jgi:hypothetical protein
MGRTELTPLEKAAYEVAMTAEGIYASLAVAALLSVAGDTPGDDALLIAFCDGYEAAEA